MILMSRFLSFVFVRQIQEQVSKVGLLLLSRFHDSIDNSNQIQNQSPIKRRHVMLLTILRYNKAKPPSRCCIRGSETIVLEIN